MSATVRLGYFKRNFAEEWICYGASVDGQPAPKPVYFKTEGACRKMFVDMVGPGGATGVVPVQFVPDPTPGVIAWNVFKTG